MCWAELLPDPSQRLLVEARERAHEGLDRARGLPPEQLHRLIAELLPEPPAAGAGLGEPHGRRPALLPQGIRELSLLLAPRTVLCELPGRAGPSLHGPLARRRPRQWEARWAPRGASRGGSRLPPLRQAQLQPEGFLLPKERLLPALLQAPSHEAPRRSELTAEPEALLRKLRKEALLPGSAGARAAAAQGGPWLQRGELRRRSSTESHRRS